MRAGKGFTYRYYNGEALFPFGHGMSYTKFQYSDIKINRTTVCKNDEINVSVKVKNIGELDGEEVVQLYIKDIKSNNWTPHKQLREFIRISLKKNEEKIVNFVLNPRDDFKYYDLNKQDYDVEPGNFEIQIGSSSKDIRLKKTIKVID